MRWRTVEREIEGVARMQVIELEHQLWQVSNKTQELERRTKDGMKIKMTVIDIRLER